MNEREQFEMWLKNTTTERKKSDTTAYNYSRAIKRISNNYREMTGKSIDLFKDSLDIVSQLEKKYALNGEYSSFGQNGNGTVRNALSALIRFRRNFRPEQLNEEMIEEYEEYEELPNFHYESDLQETIQFQINELFPNYKIFGENCEEGIKYKIEGKEIDILLEGLDGNSLLIVELKAGKASEKVFGQIAMYFGLVKKRFPNKDIKGIIIAQEISEGLINAGFLSDKISFMSYSLQVKLFPIN